MSLDTAIVAVLVCTIAVGSYAVVTLHRIARDTREILQRARVRDQADGLATGASVVDFAIHLDRRHEIAVGGGASSGEGFADPDDGDGAARASRLPARNALRDLKSRLADIPSVRRGS
ncbi:MAG TPA: hypothetical protein VFD92_12705 [Candidatus Binatia bacterium]|nr:hypothetical protein [Candidatus Binatia bacterium]